MSRQSLTFLITFLLAVGGVAPLVYAERPLLAVGVGIAGLLVHWALSRGGDRTLSRDGDRDGDRADDRDGDRAGDRGGDRAGDRAGDRDRYRAGDRDGYRAGDRDGYRGGDRDDEVADSSYFFGFLLTLVFLTVGLYRIGVQAGAAAGSIEILGFLADLAAGLALTIAGLLIRQVRTLTDARAATQERAAAESSAAELQRQLADNLRAMIELWRARPEHQVLDVLEQSRSAARDAANRLDRDLAAAGGRMLASVERLDQATAASTQSLTRAAAGVGSSMTQMAERLEVDIGAVVAGVQAAASDLLKAMEQQRTAADAALTSAQSQHQQQLELWRTNLEHARTSLEQANRGVDEQYRRSMTSFTASADAFAALAAQTTAHVESLPNPAERLAGLWDGVRRLEADLTEAIAGAVMELGVLRERAEQLRTSLDQLGDSTDHAADMIATGGERLAGSLQRELAQMNGIIEEYVALLEKTPRSLKVRA